MKEDPASVLYVDDSESNLFLVQLIMEEAGLVLHTATTGEEGIHKISNVHYDLIFTDIHLPNADGFAVLKNARQETSLNEFTPVVAFTADVTIENRGAIMDAGFTDFIGKPFKSEDLNLLLTVFLNKEPFAPPNFFYYSDFIKTEEEKSQLRKLLQKDFYKFERDISQAWITQDWAHLLDALHKIEFTCSNLKLDSFLQAFKIIRAEAGFTPTANAESKKIKSNLLKFYPYFN